ncbi:maltooligosyl trehalose synthase [Tistlia consotensis]|uniref:Maltooligosyl trehalose synthase n=1 Tax=Tistlia consotensis USBA 355 TaxID=560819 RepID=A0A1Y6CD03_9PROT|nr:malto-oligosyltrehalose synthase [Tistlia consotensis]SMF57397.1 maltooligosyl trehalose synthase [Tistlia consotensis USBA 355]SNR45681.1 maltooligosyl trehalose synthase [Tistlia consotensis]
MTLPRATYRLQFREGMDFARAAALAPYWRQLGISHLYASPVFAAAAGSTHGYDVTDFNRIEPALGGEAGLRALAGALRREGLGLILDFVPNHMSATPDNPWWAELLEWGEASPTATFFDIDWAADKLLIPTLGAPYAEVLEAGELAFGLETATGRLLLRYHETALPLNPPSAATLLARSGDATLQGLASPLASALPESVEALRADLRRRLTEPGVPEAFRATLAALSQDRELVHAVHEAQVWRLVHWRAARDSLTYRRFFEITGLIGVRVEEPAVFDAVHGLLLRLVEEGLVQGLRLDHVDGLADPRSYLERLAAALPDGTYLVVEKILEDGETLPAAWPVAGTTGYEFIAALAAGLCDQAGLAALGEAYEAFVGRPLDLEDEVAAAKRQILTENLAAELATLVRQAAELAQRRLATRDFGEDSLRRAIIALVLAFPVYRSYVDEAGAGETDRRLIAGVAERAKQRPDVEEPRTVDFVVSLLLLEVEPEDSEDALRFTTRFQQTTGPIMAKALEDTVFYRQHRLIALNEVSGDPGLAEASAEAFHRAMLERRARQPHGLSATATHDTKRGEDARARLYALSEAPALWARAVGRWSTLNARLRSAVDEGPVPEPETEWLIYQTLLGAWPADLEPDDGAGLAALSDRITAFLEKALREAKLRTRWTAPDEPYEAAVRAFAEGLLDASEPTFLQDFVATTEPFRRAGAVNSLSQSLLKLTAPGIPDLYQGTEGWDLSLVDPDNRRPVAFGTLDARLEGLGERPLAELLADWRSGAIKQRVLQAGLAWRRARPQLFAEGDYGALRVVGAEADRVIAFARRHRDRAAVVVVPRRPLGLLHPELPAIPAAAWGDTAILLPEALQGRRFVDALSGAARQGAGSLPLRDLLDPLPLAALDAV